MTDLFDQDEPERPAEGGYRGRHAAAGTRDEEWDHELADEEAYHHEFDEEYETIRLSRGGVRRWVAALLVLLLLVVVAVAAGAFYVQRQFDPPGDPGEVVLVEIPPGSTSDAIGSLLEDRDVVSSAFWWRWYLRINDGGPFQAGEYELRRNSSMAQAIEVLEAGPIPPELTRVTIPEGLTIRAMVGELGGGRFSADRMRELIQTGAIGSRTRPQEGSYEGLLFPDTYEVGEDDDEQQLLQRMADQMDAVLDQAGADARGAELGLSRYEVVIVASLIEEEARLAEEQPKMARVIYNRLEQGIPLGIDATSRYEAEIINNGSRDDLDFDSDSPYNTRRVAGLPPTPIAAPGRSAIEAALNPEPGPWLYYVLQSEDGQHFFTDSFAEFNEAKAECAAKGLGCG